MLACDFGEALEKNTFGVREKLQATEHRMDKRCFLWHQVANFLCIASAKT